MRPTIMKYFRFEHLPAHLQAISKPFADLAEQVELLPSNDPAEKATALRKILEAKDAAVRSMLPILIALVALGSALVPSVALAQVDAQFAQHVDSIPAVEGVALAEKVFDAIARGDMWTAAGAGVALLVWLLRKPLRRFLPEKIWPVLDHPIVAFATPLIVATFGGFATAALAGPITGAVVKVVLFGALKTAMASAFTFLLGSNVKEAVTTPPPTLPIPLDTKASVEAFNRASKGPQP